MFACVFVCVDEGGVNVYINLPTFPLPSYSVFVDTALVGSARAPSLTGNAGTVTHGASCLRRAGPRAAVQCGRHKQDPGGEPQLAAGAELHAAQPVGHSGGQESQE